MPKAPPKPKIGRPATGKRSNPLYRQASFWLRKDTLGDAMRATIADDGTKADLSDIVQNLLERWLASGAKLPK